MKALTLWRPWDAAILRWPGRHRKLIENRSWAPPSSMLGRFIAIHAGKRYDREAAAEINFLAAECSESNGGWRVPSEAECPTGIVGVVRLVGVVDADDNGDLRLIAGEGPASFGLARFGVRDATDVRVTFPLEPLFWWNGGVAWVLANPIAITPVPCKGAQGLWTVPVDVAATVRDRVRSARAGR